MSRQLSRKQHFESQAEQGAIILGFVLADTLDHSRLAAWSRALAAADDTGGDSGLSVL